MKNRYLFILLLTCLAVFSHPGKAGFNNVSEHASRDTICEKQIIVKVTDISLGNSISGAQVTLLDATGKIIAKQQTDAQGNASFTVPCNNEYSIMAGQDFFEPRQFPVNVAPDALSPIIVEVQLTPILQSSGQYLLEHKVQVYNPYQRMLLIRFGENDKSLREIKIAKGSLWESPSFYKGKKLRLWVTSNNVINKYDVEAGKAYKFAYKKTKMEFRIQEVPRTKQ